ncbi:hypothetical protein H4R33_005588 [Dimargaris cristalligena]|nr:hypothetical protein H4R33_005588 [Dimargaris cristalligena]
MYPTKLISLPRVSKPLVWLVVVLGLAIIVPLQVTPAPASPKSNSVAPAPAANSKPAATKQHGLITKFRYGYTKGFVDEKANYKDRPFYDRMLSLKDDKFKKLTAEKNNLPKTKDEEYTHFKTKTGIATQAAQLLSPGYRKIRNLPIGSTYNNPSAKTSTAKTSAAKPPSK